MESTPPTRPKQAIHWPPEPPCTPSITWVEDLRWLITVMDGDNSSLAFIASVLAYTLNHHGKPTTGQCRAIRAVHERVLKRWHQGTLACQLAVDHPLADVETTGRA